ncbi:hypothetical protein ACQKFG_16150 [Peribacillus sp. NPDC076916]|uniref:hypothetical protein n=1 Tax=Peribacillus sp. NPDC076916 TaxID=3390608 RepID=UPI003D0665B7
MEVWREILCIWSKYSWVWTLLVSFALLLVDLESNTREFGANTREFRAFTREFGEIVWVKPRPCPALRGRCFKAINKKETPLLKSGASDIRSLRCGMISFEQIHISEFS